MVIGILIYLAIGLFSAVIECWHYYDCPKYYDTSLPEFGWRRFFKMVLYWPVELYRWLDAGVEDKPDA